MTNNHRCGQIRCPNNGSVCTVVLFSRLCFICFQPIVCLHRLLQLTQLVPLWSYRKIHCVSLNHQQASGEEPFLLCGPHFSILKKLHRRCWKTVISLAVTLERRSPRVSLAHHTSGSGLGRVGPEVWRRPDGLRVMG